MNDCCNKVILEIITMAENGAESYFQRPHLDIGERAVNNEIGAELSNFADYLREKYLLKDSTEQEANEKE